MFQNGAPESQTSFQKQTEYPYIAWSIVTKRDPGWYDVLDIVYGNGAVIEFVFLFKSIILQLLDS